MNPILLDTHAALWAVDGKLRREVVNHVDSAAERGELLLSRSPLGRSVAAAAALLPDSAPADPADRFLIATAAAYGAQFITHDRQIRSYAKATGYLRCIAC